MSDTFADYNPEIIALHGFSHIAGLRDIQSSHVNADLFKEPKSLALHGLRLVGRNDARWLYVLHYCLMIISAQYKSHWFAISIRKQEILKSAYL